MYALIQNQTVIKFPYSFSDLRRDNPQVSYPQKPSAEALESYGLIAVVSTGAQYDQATQVATQEGCEYSAELQRWQTSWTVRSKTLDELAADATELQQSIIEAVQQRLDTFSKTRNYDGILSACTYASSTIPQFASEGQAAVNARDATWATLYTILGEVQAGTRPVPTGFADIEAALPVLVWPA